MSELTSMYDSLKKEIDRPAPSNLMNVGGINNSPVATQWRNMAAKEADKLTDGCAKKVLLDIYCKIVPLDNDFVKGNQGLMKQDVDSFLANKGQTAIQYFTSGCEKTKAPLLEFIVRSCNNIGRKFMEDAQETLKDAQKNNISVPPPSADVESLDTINQVADITGSKEKNPDLEYEEFIEKIKKKTIKRIIDEVSELINTKRESKKTELNLSNPPSTDLGTPPTTDDTAASTGSEASLDSMPELPKLESTISIATDYLNMKLWDESSNLSEKQKEAIIGLAIRESTFNILDTVFKQPDTDLRYYRTRIKLGKGVVVNESALSYIKENA